MGWLVSVVLRHHLADTSQCFHVSFLLSFLPPLLSAAPCLLPAILHSSSLRPPPAPTSLIVLLPSHFSGMAESNGNRLSFQRSFGFHGSTSSPKDGAHLLQAPVSPLSEERILY